MKMRLSIVFAASTLVFIALYVMWPTAAHINPDLPQPGLVTVPQQSHSSVTVPVEIGFSELSAVIEKHFPDRGVLHRARKQESKSLSYRYTVRRWGPPSFTINDGALVLDLPLRIDATGRKDICIGFKRGDKCKGIKTHETGDATAFVDAKALIALIVNEDYQIEVGSNVTQQLSNTPYLNMDLLGDAISIKINIEGEVEKLLAREEGKVSKALDNLLAAQFAKLKLKETLQAHWQSVRSPIPIGDAWISLDPQQVFFKGVHQLSEGRVALAFGFSGPTTLSLTKPKPVKAGNMPRVSSVFEQGPRQHRGDFNLAVPLSSAFTDLNTQARAMLVGRTLHKDNYWLTIQGIELTGATLKNSEDESRGTLVAAVTFEAGEGSEAGDNIAADGTLHLTFMPSINNEARTLEIVDVAATSDTLSLLDAAGVSWLNSQFTPEIMAQLTYDYGEQIDIWKPRLNTKLAEGINYKGVTIKGKLNDIGIGGFYVSGSELQVYLYAEGTVAAALHELKF